MQILDWILWWNLGRSHVDFGVATRVRFRVDAAVDSGMDSGEDSGVNFGVDTRVN